MPQCRSYLQTVGPNVGIICMWIPRDCFESMYVFAARVGQCWELGG